MPFRRHWITILFVLAIADFPLPAIAQETYLVGIHQGSNLADMAERLGYGGYELSDGRWQSFDGWYRSPWIDMRFEMMTQLSDNVGILWGLSTGQSARKLRIDPSVKLGVILQVHPTPSTTLSFTASSTLGGNLRELPCTADYGAIGGIQTVNCRLAASPIPPAETLKYLVRASPSRLTLSLWFRGTF